MGRNVSESDLMILQACIIDHCTSDTSYYLKNFYQHVSFFFWTVDGFHQCSCVITLTFRSSHVWDATDVSITLQSQFVDTLNVKRCNGQIVWYEFSRVSVISEIDESLWALNDVCTLFPSHPWVLSMSIWFVTAFSVMLSTSSFNDLSFWRRNISCRRRDDVRSTIFDCLYFQKYLYFWSDRLMYFNFERTAFLWSYRFVNLFSVFLYFLHQLHR